MANVYEHPLGWAIEKDGEFAIGEFVGDPCPLTAAVRAHAIDQDAPVRIETADGIVIELDFLSFGDFHQAGDPERATASGKAERQIERRYEGPCWTD